MRQFMLAFAFMLLGTTLCHAETTVSKEATDKAKQEEVSANISLQQLKAVISESSFFNEKPAVFHPECDNPRLKEKVLARIQEYYQEKKQTSIVDERRQALMLKRLKSFVPVDVKSFQPQENYNVADRLIDIKINDGVKAQDLSLCKSTGDREIYLLIYPQNNFYTVEIINFPGQPDSKKFTTVYD